MLKTSEVLFLLIGNNPLPNYVAAKLLAKPFPKGTLPTIYLVHSSETKEYAENLSRVLGTIEYQCLAFEVNPWDYSDIKKQVETRIKHLKETAQKLKYKVSVGLNYTGGTKAMSVHAYRAIKSLEDDSFTVQYSYLDSNTKAMRFDVEDGSQNIPIQLANSTKPEFEQTKISLDNLLALHGWKKLQRPTENPITNLRFSPSDLNLSNRNNFNGDMFEDFVYSQIQDLKAECNLNSIGTNLEICVPNESSMKFFELDVVAIRGYQLFVISCTLEGRNDGDGKHLRKAKLFEAVHRARQLGGAEAQICLVSMADSNRTTLLKKQLKDDHIRVFGRDDLSGLKSKLKRWFEGN